MDWKKVFKNTAWLSIGQAVGRAIGFLYFVFLARYLGVSDFGVWNWVLGLGYNFYPLADFGIRRYVLKHLPRNPERKKDYLAKLLPFRLLLAVVSVFLSSLLALILGSKIKAGYMLIFGLALLPHNLLFLYTSIKNAFERMHVFGLATMGVSLGYTLTGLLMIKLGLGLGWLFGSYFFGVMITLVGLNLLTNKLDLTTKWDWDPRFYQKVISESWAFGLLQIIAVFYLRISLILIGMLLGDYQAGIYGSASKFVEAGILFPQSVAIAFFPSFSKLYVEDKERLKKTYLRALPILIGFSIPFFLVMWFGSHLVIPAIYGPEYLAAAPVFKLMGILMIFFFVNSLAGNVIQNSDRVIQFLPFRVINFLVAIIVGVLIIPRLGVIGGVWTLIIGEIYGLLVNNIFVAKILHGKNTE